MEIIYAIVKTIGLPACVLILLLGYYEGVPGANRIAFPVSWPLVGGFGLVDVPVIGDLTAGKIHTYAAQQVKLAKAGLVSKVQVDTLEAQLKRERENRAIADQAATEARKRAAGALRARNAAQEALDARIAADTSDEGATLTEEDIKWLAQ